MDLNKARSVANSRWVSFLLLFTLYWITSTASVSGFIGKWALRDANPEYGIERVLDNTAIKPFAYRILLPTIANFAERITPGSVKAYAIDKLGPYHNFVRTTSSNKPAYAFRYIVIMYSCLGFCIGSLFVLRKFLLDLKFSIQTATSMPVVFILAFPFVQTIGGYFYDYTEVFFLSASVLLALRNQWLLLCLIAIPATLNKEAFFFFIPTLYPLLRTHASRKFVLSILAASVVISGMVNAVVKWIYLDAGGGAAHFQLLGNMQRYLMLKTYGQLEVTYGFVGPSGAFIGTLLVIAIVVFRGWSSCPASIRQHICIAFPINLPLLLLFCATGEMRNLSLLFVGFIVLTASMIEKPTASSRAVSEPASAPSRLSTMEIR